MTTTLVITHDPERHIVDAYTPGRPGPGATAYLPVLASADLNVDLYDEAGVRVAEGRWDTDDPAVARQIVTDALARLAQGEHPGCGWAWRCVADEPGAQCRCDECLPADVR